MEIKITPALQNYIETYIFPRYQLNDCGHRLDHIEYVIRRSFKFAEEMKETLNMDMIYTVACYHDCGHSIDPADHERISGEILFRDYNLRKFFTEEEIIIMKEAVEDHRASSNHEPRNIYGKIVSSADRNTDVDTYLRRTYQYRLKNHPEYTPLDIMNDAIHHMIKKFGVNGYANDKMFFKDQEYEKFLEETRKIIYQPDVFQKRYIEVNQIDL